MIRTGKPSATKTNAFQHTVTTELMKHLIGLSVTELLQRVAMKDRHDLEPPATLLTFFTFAHFPPFLGASSVKTYRCGDAIRSGSHADP